MPVAEVQVMSSLILSRSDLDFMLYEWLDVTRLTQRDRYAGHSRETFDAILSLSAQIATEQFAPHNRASDLQEPTLEDGTVRILPEVSAALHTFAESGLLAATMDEELGGSQLPHVVQQASFLWFQAANLATAGYAMLTMANAHLLTAHAAPDLVETYVTPMVEGRWFGTMCLSEPDVGSSLGDLTTRAERQTDGTFRLSGTKMWISGGDHEMSDNIVHLILARTGSRGLGTRGLSLFLVPKWLVGPGGRGERNDVTLVGLNHKMGYRGTVNTVLAFGAGEHRPGGLPGAIGYLIGQEGHGLAYMFHMMNETRIGVGAGAAALGYTGYLHALSHARTRVQGRELGAKDPRKPPVPIIRHPDVRRMLLASKSYVEGAVALVLYAARLLDESKTAPTETERREAGLFLDLLTPMVKSWPSQWGLAAHDLAIQVLGGSGYVRDSPVEQFYRDNRLNPIHEGTHGIQALDLLGRKVRAAEGTGLRLLVGRMRATARSVRRDLPDEAAVLEKYADRILAVTEALWATGDECRALANAAVYLEAVGHIVVAWLWLEQAAACRGREGTFYEGKRTTARYFLRHELPRVDAQLDLLESGDCLLLELDDSVL